MEAVERYFFVVVFIVLYKEVLISESADEMRDHSNESHAEQNFPMVLCIILCNVVLTFESVDEIISCDHSNVSC